MMDSYQFDKLREDITEIKQLLFWLNYPEARPPLEKKDKPKGAV